MNERCTSCSTNARRSRWIVSRDRREANQVHHRSKGSLFNIKPCLRLATIRNKREIAEKTLFPTCTSASASEESYCLLFGPNSTARGRQVKIIEKGRDKAFASKNQMESHFTNVISWYLFLVTNQTTRGYCKHHLHPVYSCCLMLLQRHI